MTMMRYFLQSTIWTALFTSRATFYSTPQKRMSISRCSREYLVSIWIIPRWRINVSKGLYYINTHGNEIHPTPNPDYLSHLSIKDVLVYSCGSLWTRYDGAAYVAMMTKGVRSIVPCLSLRGVASAIACSRSLRAKVLLCPSPFNVSGARSYSSQFSESSE